MNAMTARALSFGVVVAVWTLISELGKVNLSLWAVIVAIGLFVAAGGGVPGLQKTVVGAVSGVVWALLAYTVATSLGRQAVWQALVLGAAVFMMVFLARVPLLSFTAGVLAGAGVAMGLRTTTIQGGIRVAVALALGAVLGFAADYLATLVAPRRARPASS